MTLPVYPPPLPDEWLGSWVWRLAQANATGVYALLMHLGIEPVTALSEDGLIALSKATGQPFEALHAMNSLIDPLLDVGRKGRLPPLLIGVRYVQVCPHCLREDCLEEDGTPYLRLNWVRQTQAVCARHGVTLLDQCPHCQKDLLLTKPLHSNTQPAAPALAPRKWLSQCWLCGYDLTQATAQRVTIYAQNRPAREEAEHDWSPFRVAVWTVFAASHVVELLSPAQLHLRPLPRQQVSKPFAQPLASRLALQDLHDWIFFGQGDDFADWMTRLRSVATALLGRLETEMTSPKRWLYLSWLLTRINDDHPHVLKQDFSPLTTALMAHWRGDYVVPDVEAGWTLTDDQWEMVAPHLEWAGLQGVDVQEAFRFLVRWSVLRGNASVFQHDQYVNFRKQIVQWRETGTLGVVLGLLEWHLNAGRRANKTRLWMYAVGEGQPWQVQTARWLLSDGAIELARETNRPLHRKLLMALVAGYEHSLTQN